MTYATKQNIDDLYGVDLLNKIADRNRNGQFDQSVIDRGLRSADGIINGYLEGKYTLPLNGTSDMLVEIAVDIAIYKICLARDIRTTEMRTRYDDALALLAMIASGKIGLGLDPTTGTPGDGTVTPAKPTMTGRSIDTYRK